MDLVKLYKRAREATANGLDAIDNSHERLRSRRGMRTAVNIATLGLAVLAGLFIGPNGFLSPTELVVYLCVGSAIPIAFTELFWIEDRTQMKVLELARELALEARDANPTVPVPRFLPPPPVERRVQRSTRERIVNDLGEEEWVH